MCAAWFACFQRSEFLKKTTGCFTHYPLGLVSDWFFRRILPRHKRRCRIVSVRDIVYCVAANEKKDTGR
jgi:hypothetical protein